MFVVFVFFFKQKTAYEMRISDWSSDVCSSDLRLVTAIENIIADRPGQAVPFLHKCMERPRDALTMQALVAHGPAHDLPHALHLIEAREVHQHSDACEKLQSIGTAAEQGPREGDFLVRIAAAGRLIITVVFTYLLLANNTIIV